MAAPRARRRVPEPGEPAARARRRAPQGDCRAPGARLRPLADRAAALRRGARRCRRSAAAVGVVIAWWTTRLLSRVADARVAVPRGHRSHARRSARCWRPPALRACSAPICFALGPAWSLSRADAHARSEGRHRTARPPAMRRGPVLVVGAARGVARARRRRRAVRARRAQRRRRESGFSLDHQLVVGLDPSLAGYNEARDARGVSRDARSPARAARRRGRERCVDGAVRRHSEGRTVRRSPRPTTVEANFDRGRRRLLQHARAARAAGPRVHAARKSRAADARPRRPSSTSRSRASCSATPMRSAVRSRCRSTRARRRRRSRSSASRRGMRHDLFDAAPVAELLRRRTADSSART